LIENEKYDENIVNDMVNNFFDFNDEENESNEIEMKENNQNQNIQNVPDLLKSIQIVWENNSCALDAFLVSFAICWIEINNNCEFFSDRLQTVNFNEFDKELIDLIQNYTHEKKKSFQNKYSRVGTYYSVYDWISYSDFIKFKNIIYYSNIDDMNLLLINNSIYKKISTVLFVNGNHFRTNITYETQKFKHDGRENEGKISNGWYEEGVIHVNFYLIQEDV
jgi:hypothetical protein